jgi:hypothetical protein
LHKLKLVKLTENGFIASKIIRVKSGMPFNTKYTGLFDVVRKTILRDFVLYPDKDIVDKGILTTKFIIK